MIEKGFTVRLRTLVSRSPSERAFAREVGIPYGTLSGLLNGKSPRLETLVAIASAKDVEYRWLATGDGPENQGLSGSFPVGPDPELFGRIVDVVDRVHRDEQVHLQKIDLGRIAAEKYAEISGKAVDQDDWPALLDLLGNQLRRTIRSAAIDPATVKREA